MEEYIVSARKYRPMTFDSVVGQTALTTTLKNAVKSGKLAHAYLFCGPRGVGKTTCARIFAKAINCEHPTNDGEACNQCESCQAFNEQRSLNIFELDAASNNSVDHIKTLMEQTRIPPQVGHYKVFIIDEVHMLSPAAFNAFLKTLEEPPAHVIFILATTEKHKILPTILSRCQIYDFERMTIRDTINHLKRVAEKEGIKYEEEALNVIAEKADGGMRDALSIFDQVTSFCQGNITYQKVVEDLNVLDADNYFRIVDLSLENKAADIMVLLNSILTKGFDGGLLINGLAKHARNVMMAKDESTLPLLEVSEQMRERYKAQAQKSPTTFLYKALKLMNQCDINYRQSSNKRLLVELTLIEIAQITQPEDNDAGAGRKPRRLKSLFHNIVRLNRPATRVPQVTPAENKTVRQTQPAPNTTTATADNHAVAEAQPAAVQPATTSYSTAKRLTLRTEQGAIGYSWQNLRQAAKPKKMQIIPGSLDASDPNVHPQENENEQFTQQELELQWMSMCNRMPQNLSGVAARMKNMRPTITTFPQVEVVADNALVYEQLNGIKAKISSTLKIYLHNNFIELSIRLAEQQEQVKILSRREQFEEMSKKNPAIEKLRQLMDLELA